MARRRVALVVALVAGCDEPPPGDPSAYTVTVTVEGGGAVFAPGLSCAGSTCSGAYAAGTMLTLQAPDSTMHRFTGWSGACAAASTGACNLLVDGPKVAGAHFLRRGVQDAWAAGGVLGDEVETVAVDASGRAWIGGASMASFDVGAVTVTSAGGRDAFLARLDDAGHVVDAFTFGGPDASPMLPGDAIHDLAFAGDDPVVVGVFTGAVDFGDGGGPLVPVGASDAFVARLTAEGAVRWVRHLGGSESELAIDLVVDGAGHVTAGGWYVGVDVDLGGGTVPGGGERAFVARYDGTTGALLWARTMPGELGGLAVAGTDIVATGHASGDIDFGGPAPVSVDGIWLARYDAAGQLVWATTLPMGTYTDRSHGVATTPSGDIIVVGSMGGVPSVIIARYTGAGELRWQRRAEAASSPTLGADVVAVGEDVFLVGQYSGTIDFGGGPLPTGVGAFAVRLDADGGHFWSVGWVAKGAAGFPYLRMAAVARTPGGGLLVGGYFQGSVDFGLGEQTSTPGYPDIAVLRMEP